MAQQARQTKILVIDDEKGLCDMLVYALSGCGYAVTTAKNGKEAVAKAAKEVFDLALCDLMMPEMGGLETLKALKTDHPRMEVVMVTGYATLENAIESMKLGAYDYISKPYEIEHLCGVLERALERARLKEQVVGLEFAQRLKSDFLAHIGRGLRSPLSAILDAICGPTPPEPEKARRILADADNLAALIGGLRAATVGRPSALLAVDDDAQAVGRLREVLAGADYPVIAASSSADALRLMREAKPFAVALNMLMPRGESWTFLQELSADPELAAIPVVTLSMRHNEALSFTPGVYRRTLKDRLLSLVAGK